MKILTLTRIFYLIQIWNQIEWNTIQGKPETMSNILLVLLGKYLFNFKMEIHTAKNYVLKKEVILTYFHNAPNMYVHLCQICHMAIRVGGCYFGQYIP